MCRIRVTAGVCGKDTSSFFFFLWCFNYKFDYVVEDLLTKTIDSLLDLLSKANRNDCRPEGGGLARIQNLPFPE
jgi:hypothetical protein